MSKSLLELSQSTGRFRLDCLAPEFSRTAEYAGAPTAVAPKRKPCLAPLGQPLWENVSFPEHVTIHQVVAGIIRDAVRQSRVPELIEDWVSASSSETRQSKSNAYGILAGQFDPNPYDLLRDEIRGFADLPVGWDSYGAHPPSAAAIQRALDFLGVIEEFDFQPEWVVPTSDESILLRFPTDDGVQEWEFHSTGQVSAMIQDEAGDKVYVDVPNSLEETERLLSPADYAI